MTWVLEAPEGQDGIPVYIEKLKKEDGRMTTVKEHYKSYDPNTPVKKVVYEVATDYGVVTLSIRGKKGTVWEPITPDMGDRTIDNWEELEVSITIEPGALSPSF